MSSAVATYRPDTLDRMVRAVEKVRERLSRATRALEAAGVPYAVAGGNAVAAWVAQVDETAVRNTRDVDVMISRSTLELARNALENEGFVYRKVAALDIFLDGASGSVRDAVHIIFAGEKARAHEPVANPSVDNFELLGSLRVLSLKALVQIKLTAWRDKDKTHLRDLIDVGLIDQSWVKRYPFELGDRLQHLINTPDG
jgi:hypothetical protein